MPHNERGQRVYNNKMSNQRGQANSLRSTTAALQAGKPPRGPRTPKTSSKGPKTSASMSSG